MLLKIRGIDLWVIGIIVLIFVCFRIWELNKSGSRVPNEKLHITHVDESGKVVDTAEHQDYPDPNKEDEALVIKYDDMIWALKWPETENTEKQAQFFKTLKPEWRVLWATWLVEAHVKDWGFDAYFRNEPHPYFHDEALRGFRELGAKRYADLFEKILSYYREKFLAEVGKDTDVESAYNKVMGNEVIEKALGDIHAEFFNHDAELYRAKAAYIQKHQQEFDELERIDNSL